MPTNSARHGRRSPRDSGDLQRRGDEYDRDLERDAVRSGRPRRLVRRPPQGRFPGAGGRTADGPVLGYGSFGEFRPFEGFRHTVEHSVYVLDEAQGRGIGRMLLAALIEEARGMGKRVMVGAIDATNYASLALHENMGFEETGRMPGVGEKFGKRLDLVLVQLML